MNVLFKKDPYLINRMSSKIAELGCAARVAQLVERLICNEDVAGSTPVSGSRFLDSHGWGSRVVKGNRL